MNNHHQLAYAWKMYTDDNQDLLLLASSSAGDGTTVPGEPVWVNGTLNFSGNNRSNYDINKDIVPSPMWPYCGKKPEIWRCPADRSYVVVPGQGQLPRVRTMSMNLYLGGFGGQNNPNNKYDPTLGLFNRNTWQMYFRSSDLANPGRHRFLFLWMSGRMPSIWAIFIRI